MESKQKTAFVAGATGFTGREVIRVLCDKGVETVAHIRPGSSSLHKWGPAFETLGATVDTTPWEPEALQETMEALEPDLVFGCLGTTRKRASAEGLSADEAYERVDYGLTVMLLDAALAAPAPRFVYISAAGIGGSEPRGAYMKARWKVEQALEASGIPYTVARPSFIIGEREDGRPMETLGARVADGLLSAVGLLGATRLRNRYRSTTNTVLAAALVRGALQPSSDCDVLESEDLRLERD